MKKILALALLVGVCASLNAGIVVSKGAAVAKGAYGTVCTRDGKFDADRTLVRGTAIVVVGTWLNRKSPVGFYLAKEEEGKKTCSLRRIRCWKK